MLEGCSKNMSEDRWKKLEVYQIADDMAFKVYQVTKLFPNEELYGITSQLRRSSLSIPTNIVEGYSRKGDKELSRFLSISLGSLAETKYLIHFSNRLGYLDMESFKELEDGYDVLGKKLWRFYETINS